MANDGPKKRARPSEKSLANLRPAKKGEIRNPLGCHSHDQEKKRLKQLTRKHVSELGTLILLKDNDELEKIARNNKIPFIKKFLAGVALDADRHNRLGVIDSLLDRVIGTVKHETDVNITNIHGGKSEDQIRKEIAEYEQVEKLEKQKAEAIETTAIDVTPVTPIEPVE